MALLKLVFILTFAFVNSELPVDYVVDIDVNALDESASVNRNDETISYRLPEDFDPIHCEIEITPYFNEAPTEKEQFTFDGKAMLRIRALKDNLQHIIIHDNVRNISKVNITDDNDVPLPGDILFDRIPEYQFLRINLTTGQFENGAIYNLYIDYIGNINETPLSRGMFRGYYIDQNNETRWYSATHLQPTHSRQLFPSFDEPGFKSTFDIIVNRPVNFTNTFSNMRMISNETQGDRVREVFDTTPRMSAYLISIHISDGFQVIADNNDSEKSYRIIARPTANGQGEYALEIGPPLTKWFDDYLGIGYYNMSPYLKNDQLASPFWASGATENWGLVTYRELRLLYEAGQTNALDKMYIGTITAHELAHKWFGNYITCRWWDNVWINEGFASYFEYFAMDGVDKNMDLERQFNIMYLQAALSSDSAVNTRALRHTVNSPTEVTGHFSGISYTKGASLLLMLKHFVTEDTFKKALNRFLVDRAYEHAFPEHLYAAFENATVEDGTLIGNVNITDFMRIWVDQVGYPVLNVDVGSSSIKLSQERFYITPQTNPSQDIWPLPLTYTSGDNPNWTNLTVSYVLTGKEGEIERTTGEEYVIFNVQQKGIYRVNYDAANWDKIATALNTTHTNIDVLNRAQIVDDVFALMRSERLDFNQGFRILEFLKKDTNYFSWYPAVSGFTWLRNRFLHLPDDLAEFDEGLLEYLDAVVDDVGYIVPQYDILTRTLNRLFVLSFACDIGHKGCVEDALKKFEDFKNGTALNPNLRRHVFCTALREGNYEDWQFLNERRRNSNNQADEVAMIRALGCTSNEVAIREALDIILSDEIKAQDRLNAMAWLFSGNRGNANIALQFLKEEGVVARVREAVVLPASFNSVLANLAANLDEDGLQDMEQWLQDNQSSVPEYQAGLNSISSARSNMQWGTDRAREIIKAFRGSASVLVPTTTLLITTLIALMLR